MSDKATMLRETDEAFADLRAMLHWLTEEQARRVWPGVRDSLNHIREHPVQNRDWRATRTRQTAESTRAARSRWAPGSFWGLRYPSKPARELAGNQRLGLPPSCLTFSSTS